MRKDIVVEKATAIALSHITCNSGDLISSGLSVDDIVELIENGDNKVTLWEPFEGMNPGDVLENAGNLRDNIVALVQEVQGSAPAKSVVGPETPTKRLIVPLSVSHEYGDFEYGVVDITPALAARIKTLAEAVKTLGVYKIEEFDYQLEPMRVDYDAEESADGKVVLTEPDAHSDCNCLCVTESEFFWTGNFKNISDFWSCEAIPLSVLDEPGDHDLRPEF